MRWKSVNSRQWVCTLAESVDAARWLIDAAL